MTAPSLVRSGAGSRVLRRWMSGQLTQGELAAMLILPCLLFLAVFAVYPIVNAVWTALHTLRLDQPHLGTPFVGLHNFAKALGDPDAWHAIRVTFLYTGVTVAAQFALGLAVALIIHPMGRGRGFVRAAALLPWTMAPVLAGQMWRWLFNDQAGVANDLLNRLGLISGQIIWLGVPALAFFAVTVAATWGAASYMALILLAGLQGIPDELYEAASLDGASPLRSFLAVTLPLLRPAVMVSLVLRTLGALQALDLPFAMTGGGPGNATETFALFIYKNTFQFLDFGYGAALSVILVVIALALAGTYYRVLAPRD
ncbi:MAG: sugar ABC transporter permease [Armatimonadota bacterium]|nr:sugar ABC transporter permease [Armatimonadota bacterium]